MVNQTAISARIDNYTLWLIDQENMATGRKRNRILNEGAMMYITTLEIRRLYLSHQDPDIRRKILRGFLKDYFPEAADSL